jgi:hypothetical protein
MTACYCSIYCDLIHSGDATTQNGLQKFCNLPNDELEPSSEIFFYRNEDSEKSNICNFDIIKLSRTNTRVRQRVTIITDLKTYKFQVVTTEETGG